MAGRKAEARPRGPEPDRVKIEGDWKEAIKEVVQKPSMHCPLKSPDGRDCPGRATGRQELVGRTPSGTPVIHYDCDQGHAFHMPVNVSDDSQMTDCDCQS